MLNRIAHDVLMDQEGHRHTETERESKRKKNEMIQPTDQSVLSPIEVNFFYFFGFKSYLKKKLGEKIWSTVERVAETNVMLNGVY